MKAIALLNVKSGQEVPIVESLKKHPEISDVFVTFGEYDVAIVLKADSAKELGQFITGTIRKVDGVLKTLTLIEAING